MTNIDVNLKDLLTDLIIQEKDIFKTYAAFLPEAACPALRNLLQKNMETIAKEQLEVFTLMQAKGLYPTKEAEMQAINMAKQTFKSMATQ